MSSMSESSASESSASESSASSSSSYAFNPDDISNLKLFLVADDISGNEGDYISSWTDRKQGIIFSQTEYKPILNLNAVNGHKQVYFTGSSYLTTAQNIIPGSTNRTLFVVCKYSGNPETYRGIFTDGDGGSSDKTCFSYIDEYYESQYKSIRVITHGWPNDAYAYVENFKDYSTTLASIATVYHTTTDTNSIKIRSNGSECDVSYWIAESSNIDVGDNVTQIGKYWLTVDPTSYCFIGTICEILYYDRALNSIEIEEIENYLADKYDITLDESSSSSSFSSNSSDSSSLSSEGTSSSNSSSSESLGTSPSSESSLSSLGTSSSSDSSSEVEMSSSSLSSSSSSSSSESSLSSSSSTNDFTVNCIITKIRRLVNDLNKNRWTDGDLFLWINEGYKRVWKQRPEVRLDENGNLLSYSKIVSLYQILYIDELWCETIVNFSCYRALSEDAEDKISQNRANMFKQLFEDSIKL